MTKKIKMPDGWVRVTWKDKSGKRWIDNMPVTTVGDFQLRLMQHEGLIIKMEGLEWD